ncbi:hypothetical protein AVEN_256075-1, partial [Araneus ventricosus]
EEDVPDDIKPLLMEPVAEPSKSQQPQPQPPISKSPPPSPAKSKDSDNVAVQRALAEQDSVESIEKKPNFFKRTFSERKPKK